MIWYLLSFAFAAVAYLGASPFIVERRRPAVGLNERHGSEGQFVHLSQGVTHCRWAGSARGPVAVLIHGISTPMASMETVADGLGQMGYRVLLYDLYGRGLSDAPKGLQDRQFFLRQLGDLCAYHGLTEEITVVGYSMGGSIATAFAAEYPHSVERVILLASAGIATNESFFSRFCRKNPPIGDWVHAVFAHRRILRTIPHHGPTRDISRVYGAQRRELKRRGYLPALLSSRRGMLAEVQERDHRKLARLGMPVTAIWASDDPVIPLRAVGLLALWNRKARQEVITGADHGLPYTHGPEVIAALQALWRE